MRPIRHTNPGPTSGNPTKFDTFSIFAAMTTTATMRGNAIGSQPSFNKKPMLGEAMIEAVGLSKFYGDFAAIAT